MEDQVPAISVETESSSVANSTQINQDTANSKERNTKMKTDAIVEQLEVPNNEVDIGDDNELEHTTDTISIHNKGDISPRLLAKAKKDGKQIKKQR